jgi:DNA-binding NtrC family response regulator
MSERILIAIADPQQRAELIGLCEAASWRTFEAKTPRDALAGVRACNPQIVVLGYDEETPELIRGLGEACPSAAPWVVHSNLEELDAEALFQFGCRDVLELPLSSGELQLALARQEQLRRLAQQVTLLRSELERHRQHKLLGRSRAILRVHDQVQRIASTPRTTVLVSGEVGSGKEIVARSIHHSSSRAQRPFVVVPCAFSEPGEVETLLYGPTSRAPLSDPSCALRDAEGGTLYLAQIESMDPTMQRRLLQLLQDRSWRPTDSEEDQLADLRVIASTSADLNRLVDEGRFREDLLYRLNVLSVDVPPLRERREDLQVLAEEYIQQFCRDLGRPGMSLAPDAEEALAQHGWAGNLLELAIAMERGLLAATGAVITRSDLGLIPLPGEPQEPNQGDIPLESFRLRHMEEVVIRRALISTRGNRSETARLLGVNRTTLYNKLRVYQIEQ